MLCGFLLLWLALAYVLALRLFRRASQQRESAYPLAWLRIAISLAMLCELAQLWHLLPLMTASYPRLLRAVPGSIECLLLLELVSLAFLLFGFKTTYASWAHYIFCMAIYGTTVEFEYHMDKVYVPLALLMALSPTAKVLSIDARLESRVSETRKGLDDVTVPSLYSNLILFWCIGVVYLDSVLYKLSTDIWRDGLGLWTPSSLPGFVLFAPPQGLLDQRWIVLPMGYVVLVFEALFVVLMWWRPVRPVLLLLGAFLHIGIAIVFPIPWFGLGMFAIYLLLLPDWLAYLPLRRLGFADTTIRSLATRSPHRTQLPRASWRLLLTLMIFSQGISSAVAPLCQTPLRTFFAEITSPELDVGNTKPRQPPSSRVRQGESLVRHSVLVSRTLAGIAPHGVFLDQHMTPAGHELALVQITDNGNRDWLPFTRPSGQPHVFATGRLWAYWFFRVTQIPLGSPQQIAGLEKMTAYWAYLTSQDLNDLEFIVLRKACAPAFNWRRGQLKEQLQRPWQEAARIRWDAGNCTVVYKYRTAQVVGLRTGPDALYTNVTQSRDTHPRLD